jgi:hypothetical protein
LPLQSSGEGFGRIGDACDLAPVTGGGYQKRRQSTVDTDPPAVVIVSAIRMLVGGMQVGGCH